MQGTVYMEQVIHKPEVYNVGKKKSFLDTTIDDIVRPYYILYDTTFHTANATSSCTRLRLVCACA